MHFKSRKCLFDCNIHLDKMLVEFLSNFLVFILHKDIKILIFKWKKNK
jgi:hypothetical protein